MSGENVPLIDKETIYISDKMTLQAVFEEISQQLIVADLVTKDFFEHVLEREKEFPTGMDLSVVNPELPNIAVPHTEAEFVKVRRIIPVKLTHQIKFHNMIQPQEVLDAQFLFIILNNDPAGQANILAQIMNFIATTDTEVLKTVLQSENEDEIYTILSKGIK
ncbi:PTS system, galactitol-specific IIA component [Granulicatella balaenopterae]|uniref:PTS system, galactitol-specific IIA component n=1 Tax=Granulicatella balaenopterae TaxID=137733 RepID=A0A1H9LKT5_9LACT|nr:PTS sugar transporter subunit IIA [Granulicatella balaenopterae]SER12112.1 PTS system, galactitol-specific IIA component [Granulicatella balaenopterae]